MILRMSRIAASSCDRRRFCVFIGASFPLKLAPNRLGDSPRGDDDLRDRECRYMLIVVCH